MLLNLCNLEYACNGRIKPLQAYMNILVASFNNIRIITTSNLTLGNIMTYLILTLLVHGQIITQQIPYHNDDACRNSKQEFALAFSEYKMDVEPVKIISSICTDLSTGIVF
jgi:hypothetical protein